MVVIGADVNLHSCTKLQCYWNDDVAFMLLLEVAITVTLACSVIV